MWIKVHFTITLSGPSSDSAMGSAILPSMLEKMQSEFKKEIVLNIEEANRRAPEEEVFHTPDVLVATHTDGDVSAILIHITGRIYNGASKALGWLADKLGILASQVTKKLEEKELEIAREVVTTCQEKWSAEEQFGVKLAKLFVSWAPSARVASDYEIEEF